MYEPQAEECTTSKENENELERLESHITTETREASSLQSEGAINIGDAPDGGTDAWLVLLGSALALFASFGIVNSYGVYQNYYSANLLTKASPSEVSLIGGIQLFLLYGLAPVIGRIFDAYGCRVLMPLGTVLLVISMISTSLCQEDQLYQFFLSQGVLFGIGTALIFTPALGVLGHWFLRRRALALGCAGSGASVGGIVFPIMFEHLIDRIGFRWAVRTTAFTAFACLSVACVIMKSRLTPSKNIKVSNIVDFHGFRDLQYSLAAVGAFLYFYGLFIPFFYIQVYANFHNVDPKISQYLLVLMNALGIPSRILPGMLADRIGPLQVLVPCSVASGVLIFAVWLPSKNAAGIIAFSALYGLLSGSFVTLIPAYIASRSPIDKYGARLGSIFLFDAVATLIGTPTAGAFIQTPTVHNFARLIIFCGAMVTAGGLCLGVAHLVTMKERQRH